MSFYRSKIILDCLNCFKQVQIVMVRSKFLCLVLLRVQNYFGLSKLFWSGPNLCLVLLQVQNDFGLSKLFWSGPNHFGQVQIVLVRSKLFWSGPNCFGQVQIILFRFKLDFSGLDFIIWTQPKLIDPSNTIGTRTK